MNVEICVKEVCMRSFSSFLTGLILGGLVGAAAAILLAPYSGPDLRNQIQNQVDQIQIEVRKAASERRSELEQQLSHLRSSH
jgi:gas vesicle protein